MSFARAKSFSILFLLLCSLFCICPPFVFAQTPEEIAKTKQERQSNLVEEIIADLPNLKLGENRAIVYAKIGNLLWKTDEKRARAYFQNAAGELINAQIAAEADKKNNAYNYEVIYGQNARPQILQTIAARDAELALEYLYKTRPATILKALAIPAAKNSKISNYTNNYSYIIQNENNLEQRFVRLAADQNPERAAKLLKDSLKKGFSNETLNLLKKLYEKDAKAADELAGEIVGKLLGSNFSGDSQFGSQNINVSVNILSEYIREKNQSEKYLKFPDSQMRDLVGKLVAFYLKQQANNTYYNPYAILPIVEKLAPASVAELKQMQKNSSRFNSISGYDPEISKLLSGETTAEQMVIEAKKYPVDSRRQIYQRAAGKLAQQGDINRATEILTENFDDDALEEAVRSLKWQYSYNLISAGKFAEAESLIDELPENTRAGALINLANSIYQKDQKENKSYAVAVLGKARALISEKPEDTTEMSNLMQIISAYGAIEPNEAFRLFEPLIPQINELSEAAVIVNGFQRSANIRQGEFVLTNGNSWGFYGADLSVLSKLSTADFDRVLSLINAFSRREMRISIKLQLAETAFN